MTPPRRTVGPTLVLGLGLLLGYLALTGDVTAYLSASFTPLVVATAALLVALAVWALARSDDAPDHHDHLPRVAWLLLLPVLLFALVGPHPLGAYSADRTVAQADTAPRHDYPPLPAEGVSVIGLDEFTSRFMADDPAELEGKRVRLVGFVAHPRWKPGATVLSRLKIYCCAGDALPQSVVLVDAGELPDDQWVEVTGTLDRGRSDSLPALRVEQATRIEQPKEPYL